MLPGTEIHTVGGFRVPVQDRTWRTRKTRRTSLLPRTEMNTVDGIRATVQDRT